MILATAARILFAAMLLWTGSTKLVRGTQVELVLVKLLGLRFFEVARLSSRVLVRLLAAFEIGLAVALALGLPGVEWVLVATMTAFFGVVLRAWWLHVDCGCFPDRRPSEVGSVARTGLLLVLAVAAAVIGMPSAPGLRDGLWAVGLATVLAVLLLLAYRAAAAMTARGAPTRTPHATVVHYVIADQIAADHGGRPLPAGAADEDGWLAADRAAGLSGIPVSVLLTEVAATTGPSAALLPIGALPAFEVASTRGQRPNGEPLLVGLFSSTCTKCPTHIDAVRAALADEHRPEALMIIAGPPEPAAKFVDAFADRAAVALVGFEDPLIDSFEITEFPAFYLLDRDGRVTAAGPEIGDLALPVR